MTSMTRTLAIAFVAGIATAAVAVAATERTVGQKGKVFSESEIAVKKGDTILFVNDDTISHNIMSNTAGNSFNLGSQAPGLSTPVTFDKPGEVMVICAIHPRMKLSVKVTD
jgi:plastocyanin